MERRARFGQEADLPVTLLKILPFSIPKRASAGSGGGARAGVPAAVAPQAG